MSERNATAELLERVVSGRIRALSIKQPYPHHIFYDGKDVENRDWPTKGRGWFLMHAGVSMSEIDRKDEREMAMPRGGIVGAARIVDCVSEMESVWFFGKYGFVLRDAFPLPLRALQRPARVLPAGAGHPFSGLRSPFRSYRGGQSWLTTSIT